MCFFQYQVVVYPLYAGSLQHVGKVAHEDVMRWRAPNFAISEKENRAFNDNSHL